jgi:signal transduction histidine kinase
MGRPPARRSSSQLFDVALVVFLFLVGVGGWARATPGHSASLGILSLIMCTALLWRRQAPSNVFAVVAAAALVQYILGIHPQPIDLPLIVATYSVAAYAPRRNAILVLGVDAAGALLATIRWTDQRHTFLGVIAGLAALTAIWVVGDNMRTRRAYLASLEERAARLEAERDAQAALAAAAERARIAREMHDVVAHSLSVMIAQADGASYALDHAPDRARTAMATVADTGRAALAEMRKLLGILRGADTSADLAPQPGIDRLGELIAQLRSAGLVITLTEHGDVPALTEGMSLTVYRLVQEALTNTLKHAGSGAHAQVDIRYADADVEVEVVDDGGRLPTFPRDPAGAAEPAGHGLAGMRERVAVYGGLLTAGPGPTGGWRVHARLAQPVRV